MIPKMPKQYCQQAVTLTLLTGESDIYNNPEYEPEQRIEHVIFQPQTIYNGTNNNREVVANAVAFLFVGVSTPFPKLDKTHVGSKLEFEGKEYTIQKIIDNRDPLSNEMYSYELEVL